MKWHRTWIDAVDALFLWFVSTRTTTTAFAVPVHVHDHCHGNPRRNSRSSDQETVNNDSPQRVLDHSALAAAVGFYVHIPFCRRRCRYCNFAIVPVGPSSSSSSTRQNDNDRTTSNRRTGGFEELNQNYTRMVIQEIQTLFQRENRQQQPGQGSNNKINLQSIYFGGGTPSLAPVSTIQAILDRILNDPQSPFEAAAPAGMEITLEMDPGTFDLEKLHALRNIGVNRISLGVQSFFDHVLQQLGRQHTVKDIWESIRLLREVFGNEINYSIDLISGLPGVSMAQWIETLHIAVNKLDPPPKHLSIYDLQIESGTVFAKWYHDKIENYDDDDAKKGRYSSTAWYSTSGASNNDPLPRPPPPPLPSDQDAAFQYQFTAGYLRGKGFEHYEVSSYARANEPRAVSPWRSRHNQIYWGYDTQWFAVGLGATSFVRGDIVARPRTMFDYKQWVQQQAQSQQDDEILSKQQIGIETELCYSDDLDRLTDVVLKRLRTLEGLDLDWVQSHFGERYVTAVFKGAQLALELGLATVTNTTFPRYLKLVDSQGFLYSNSIISSIFVELENVEP